MGGDKGVGTGLQVKIKRSLDINEIGKQNMTSPTEVVNNFAKFDGT